LAAALFRSACLLAVLAACDGARAVDLDGGSVDAIGAGTPTVLVFVASSCPISNKYAPEIERLGARAREKGARVYLVYPSDAPEAVRAHLHEQGLDLPALRDPRHALVKASLVSTTPEAAVFDKSGRLAYHGRIDDRWTSLAGDHGAASTHDLQDAVDAVLEGRAPAPPSGPPFGCPIEER
jgi:thiol-disulfide isomerase/thioredoxin